MSRRYQQPTLGRALLADEPIPWAPPWRPNLRQRFYVRKHPGWGAAVCWFEWLGYPGCWGINWGVACKTIREAKVLRRFLNERVARFDKHGGVPFEDVVYVVTGKRVRA